MSALGPDPHTDEPWLSDLLVALRFYARLPIPRLRGEKNPYRLPDFDRITPILPFAALIIALPSVLVLIAADLFFTPLVSAALALATHVLVTGAFHEDGLADTFDGLGGGHDQESRLQIMQDSRLGTFGACALLLSLSVRITILAALIDLEDGPETGLLWLCAAPLSRLCGLFPMMMLAPAKPDGKAAAVGKASRASFAVGLALSCGIALILPLGLDSDPIQIGLAIVGAMLAPLPLIAQAQKLIGGQTGDVAGACQQVSEIVFLLVLSATISA